MRYLIASPSGAIRVNPPGQTRRPRHASPLVPVCLELLGRRQATRVTRPTLNACPAPDIRAPEATYRTWEVRASRENRHTGARDLKPTGDVRSDHEFSVRVHLHGARLTQ